MPQVDVKTQLIDRDELQRFLPERAYRLLKFFENLGSDVAEALPNAIEQSVQGPNGAVDNHVPVFDGPTGFKVRDSGVPINALAPLDSPAFTGNPIAPTPLPGDSDTSIATTAFVQGEIAGGVKGPVVATNNAIALFDGTTGRLIKDSGTLLTSLAPLASPVLTGNPTAPTAVVGDNDASIATTAFVQAEFAARVALGAYFSAHNNGTSQSIPSGAFTRLTLGTEVYDVGSKFASNAWTPPAGRLVTLKGAVVIVGAPAAMLFAVSVFKNGAEYKRGTTLVTNAGSQGIEVVCDDVPNGTDVYDLRVYQNSGAAQNTSGLAAEVWFQGHTVQT